MSPVPGSNTLLTESGGDTQERPSRGYSKLYENIALYPQAASFRRFAAQWAKLIHDNTEEVLTNHDKLCKALEGKGVPNTAASGLNFSRLYVQHEYPDVYKNFWKPYEESLRKHGKIAEPSFAPLDANCYSLGDALCLSQQIMKLPGQANFLTEWLATFESPTFHKGRFGLTQELAEVYKGPPEKNDTCTWRELPQHDFLTKKFLQVSRWIHARRLKHSCDQSAGECGAHEDGPNIAHHVVVESMDFVTCTIASLLLTGSMFAIAHIRPLNIRIGVVGVCGTLFSWSVKLMAGPSRRVEVYAAIAAFFAVASVFVSGTDSGSGDR